MPARISKPQAKPQSSKTEYGEKEEGSIVGNLVRNPELKFSANGKPFAFFAVAVNNTFYDETTKTWEHAETEYYDVTVWGTQAENCTEYLTKGSRIVAVGYYQDQTFTNRNDERVTKTTFTAYDIGPSLKWNGAKIVKVSRSDSGEAPF